MNLPAPLREGRKTKSASTLMQNPLVRKWHFLWMFLACNTLYYWKLWNNKWHASRKGSVWKCLQRSMRSQNRARTIKVLTCCHKIWVYNLSTASSPCWYYTKLPTQINWRREGFQQSAKLYRRYETC